MKLNDELPDGFAQNIARSILRGRHRASLLKSERMQPGQVYEITVALGSVAATIAKGGFSNRTAASPGQVHHKPGALSRIGLTVQ